MRGKRSLRGCTWQFIATVIIVSAFVFWIIPHSGIIPGFNPVKLVVSFFPGVDDPSILGPNTLNEGQVETLIGVNHNLPRDFAKNAVQWGIQYGINDTFVISIFKNESGYGTGGVALITHSPGNIETPTTDECNCTAYPDPNGNSYRKYRNWNEGLHDMYRLLASYVYVGDNLTTVKSVVPKWVGDYSYTDEVVNDMENWPSTVKTTIVFFSLPSINISYVESKKRSPHAKIYS